MNKASPVQMLYGVAKWEFKGEGWGQRDSLSPSVCDSHCSKNGVSASLEQSLRWLSFFMLTGLLLSFILEINDNLASLGLAQLGVRIQHNVLPSPTPCWWGDSSGHTQAGVGANIVLLHPAFGLEAFFPHSDSLLTPTTHQRSKKYVPSAHIAPFISP